MILLCHITRCDHIDLFQSRGVGVLMEGVFLKKLTHTIQDASGKKVRPGLRAEGIVYLHTISCSVASWYFTSSSSGVASASLMPKERRWSLTLARVASFVRATCSPLTVSDRRLPAVLI